MTEPLSLVKDESPAVEPETATFKGETFKLTDDVSPWALMEFAEAVDGGLDTGSYAGLAALSRFVVELIAPEDQDRFRATARRHRATADDLFAFVRGEVEADAERPTGPSSDSSDGREITEPKSGVSYAGRVYPLAGRPDLMLAVEQARRAQAG